MKRIALPERPMLFLAGTVGISLLLVMVSLIGCKGDTRDSVVANSTKNVVTSFPPVVTVIRETPTTIVGSTATADAEDDHQTKEATRSPTPTATWPAVSAQAPCGVLLPLTSLPGQASSLQFEGEASDLASVPDSALPALERLLSAPETVGLAAFQIGRESEGVYLNAEAPMPLASVVKIVNLIAYAQAVVAGELDPAEWIPLEEINKTYLPRSDLGAHNRALADLEERNLIALDPPSTPLEEIPWMMIRHSSNAAADYLQLRLGQETIEQTVMDLGLSSHTAPCPWVGQFLTMANRQTTGNNLRAIQSYIDNPESYGQEVMRLTQSYVSDEAFRVSESESGWRASFDTQILFSENLNAQASANDYAGLMARLMQNGLASDYANILVRRTLEWPIIFPANQELFATIGFKNGSLPGILTTAYYAQRIEDGASVVVVLFYRELPRQTYRQWRQDLPHDELARWLLSDPTAIPELRSALQATG